jgi:polysaccharide biosynthesis/export protein
MKHLVIPVAALFIVAATGCRTRGPLFNPRSAGVDSVEGDFASAGLTNRIDKSMLTPSTEPYRLGPGDVIEVETIGEAKSGVVLSLGPDGKIYYNLLPGLSVWGMSLAEARAMLQREMATYTRATPELVINLRGVASKKVWVLGAVSSPGVYGLATPTTLLDALAASGSTQGPGDTKNGEGGSGGQGRGEGRSGRGFGPGIDDGAADYSRSFILRNGKRLPVDFDRLLKGGDLTQNIFLEPDDFIFVRPMELASVYVLGAVNGPHIATYRRDLTVSELLINAGGTAKYAQNGKVVIVRGGLSEPKIAEVDYQAIVTGKAINVRLQPGDIVYVPYTPYRMLAQLAEDVLDQFVRTVAVNQATYIVTGEDNPVPITAPYGISTGVQPPPQTFRPQP